LPRKFIAFQDGSGVVKQMPINFADLRFKYSEYNAVVVALRNLSGLACAYTSRPSSMFEAMKNENILEWYKTTFLPHALLFKNVIKTPKDDKDKDP
jgi:hypothetical protein